MNADIEETMKNCPTWLDFQATWPKNETMPHEMLGELWESVGAHIFTSNNKHYLCFVDYHSKFPVIKQVEGFSADNIIKKTCKIIFSEYKLSSKIISDVGTNFYFREFEDLKSDSA